MKQPGRYVWLLMLVWAGRTPCATAQTRTSVQKPTRLNRVKQPDSAQSTKPNALTFSASTDQRFFFFNDTRNEEGRRKPVTVYGARAGYIFPKQHYSKRNPDVRAAAFKAGAGFYFLNQELHQPGLLPGTSESIKRRLRMGMIFYERYLLTREKYQITLPIELGYGHSRYERLDGAENELARGVFLPVGLGISGAYQFPNVRWFRPLHWFGLNLLVGYRFVLKRDIPRSQVNYAGLYVSAGPSFFLENMTADLKAWRKKRRSKKQQNKP